MAFLWFFVFLMHHWVAAKARWSLVTSRAGPSPRFGHTAVWGGQSFWVYAGSGEVLLDDLWAFDASTSTWTESAHSRNHSLSSLSNPPPVHRHAMVWDPGTKALWISGGFDGENFLKEVWKYYAGDAGRWFRIVDSTVPGPCGRSDHVAMWDATTSALWIHGGFDGTALDDLWRFDSREGTWNKMPRVGHQPSARANHVGAFDGANLAIWIHAGHSGSDGLHRDVWRFSTKAMTWQLVSNSGPSARAYHASAWDPVNEALWIHGGKDLAPRRDLWRFDTAGYKWELIEDHSGPSRRFDHVAAWDGRSIWIHGGYEGSIFQDLWKYEIPATTTPDAPVEDLTVCLVLLAIAAILAIVLVMLLAWRLKHFKRRAAVIPSVTYLSMPPQSSPPPPPPETHITMPPPWPSSPAPVPPEAPAPILTICRFPRNTQKLQLPPNPPRQPRVSCHMQLELCVPDLTNLANAVNVIFKTHQARFAQAPHWPFFHPECSLFAPHIEAPVFFNQPVRCVKLPDPRVPHRRPCIPKPTQLCPKLQEPTTHRSLSKFSGRFVTKPAPPRDLVPKEAIQKPLRATNAWHSAKVTPQKRSPWPQTAGPLQSELLIQRIDIPLLRHFPKSTSNPSLRHPQQDFFSFGPGPKPQLPQAMEALKQLATPQTPPRSRPKRSQSASKASQRRGPWYTMGAADVTPGPGHYNPQPITGAHRQRCSQRSKARSFD